MQTDVWAVTVGSDADFYVTTVTPTDTTPLTLANTKPEYNGAGYQLSITPAGNETGKSLTVVGTGVNGQTITETVAMGNATATYSTNYFASVTSITPSGATAGAITVGYGGNLALPRTRVKGVYYVASGSAGSVVITRNSNSRVLLNLATPAGATVTQDLVVPGEGILTAAANDDYAYVAATNVTSLTLICG
jgi:hypothetical protein